jgi:HlyD family secretion protein
MSTDVATRVRGRSWTRTLWLVLGVSGTLASGVIAWDYSQHRTAEPPNLELPAPAPTSRKVHALGRLEPRGTVIQLAPPAGSDGARVERLLVAEGDDVTAGQVVAVLDLYDRRAAAVEEAAARLQAAELKLAQVKAGAKAGDIAAQATAVTRMEAELAVARKEFDRAKSLVEQRILTAENLELKQLALERAELELARAKSLLESLREVRDVDVRWQEAEIATAKAGLTRAKAELAACEVRAPSAGRILKVHTHPGERLHNLGILQMGDVAHMQGVAEIFEGDIAEIRLGLPAIIRLDSSGWELTGEVAEIGRMVARKDVLTNDPVSDTDARVVEVRIALKPGDVARVGGLSNARIEVSIELPLDPSSGDAATR